AWIATGMKSSKPSAKSLSCRFIRISSRADCLIVQGAAPLIAAPVRRTGGASLLALARGWVWPRPLQLLVEQVPRTIGAVPNSRRVRFLALRGTGRRGPRRGELAAFVRCR